VLNIVNRGGFPWEKAGLGRIRDERRRIESGKTKGRPRKKAERMREKAKRALEEKVKRKTNGKVQVIRPYGERERHYVRLRNK